jgi:IS30 family transposase
VKNNGPAGAKSGDHTQALVRAQPGLSRRHRPKQHRFAADERLRVVVARKLELEWSPAQIARWLRRRWPKRRSWHVCIETIYEAVYRGLIVVPDQMTLRTRRIYGTGEVVAGRVMAR